MIAPGRVMMRDSPAIRNHGVERCVKRQLTLAASRLRSRSRNDTATGTSAWWLHSPPHQRRELCRARASQVYVSSAIWAWLPANTRQRHFCTAAR